MCESWWWTVRVLSHWQIIYYGVRMTMFFFCNINFSFCRKFFSGVSVTTTTDCFLDRQFTIPADATLIFDIELIGMQWIRRCSQNVEEMFVLSPCCSSVSRVLSLASPAMGHWGTCPLDFQLVILGITRSERLPIHFNSTRTSDSSKTGS